MFPDGPLRRLRRACGRWSWGASGGFDPLIREGILRPVSMHRNGCSRLGGYPVGQKIRSNKILQRRRNRERFQRRKSQLIFMEDSYRPRSWLPVAIAVGIYRFSGRLFPASIIYSLTFLIRQPQQPTCSRRASSSSGRLPRFSGAVCRPAAFAECAAIAS